MGKSVGLVEYQTRGEREREARQAGWGTCNNFGVVLFCLCNCQGQQNNDTGRAATHRNQNINEIQKKNKKTHTHNNKHAVPIFRWYKTTVMCVGWGVDRCVRLWCRAGAQQQTQRDTGSHIRRLSRRLRLRLRLRRGFRVGVFYKRGGWQKGVELIWLIDWWLFGW